MPRVENKKISEVYEGKGGVTNGREWKFYNFKLEGGQLKYDFLWVSNKKVPSVGDIVSFDYEIETSGKYTNNKVGKIEFITSAPNSSPASQNSPTVQSNGGKAYIDHGKCVIELMKMCDNDRENLIVLIDIFREGIDLMIGNGEKESPHKDLSSSVRDEEPPPIVEDSIPF